MQVPTSDTPVASPLRTLSPDTYHLTPDTYHLSPDTYHLTPITCHLTSVTYRLSVSDTDVTAQHAEEALAVGALGQRLGQALKLRRVDQPEW